MALGDMKIEELKDGIINMIRRKMAVEYEKKEAVAEFNQNIKKIANDIESMFVELNARETADKNAE